MAIRYKALTELYQETQRKVTAPAEWQQFLTSACRNYRLSFDEQLLVYAQRPDATAVLEIERWNKRFGRWVNRGANGIAVFDGEHSGKQRLKYYFDVSDTHAGRFARPVPLWTVRPEYTPDIIEAMENSFGELEQKDDLGAALLSAAKNAVEDNIHDYLSELSHLTEGSFLEELAEYNVEVMYRRALQTSIGYMLVVRCGLDPSEYFEDDDFRDVLNFNTPETLNALGVAAGDISQMCLSEIARTTLALQRQPQKENRTFETAQENQYPVTEQKIKQPERSIEYDRDHVQQTGQLQPAESSAPAGAGSGSWEIRITSPEVPKGESQDHLHQSADQRQAERPSGRDRADGTLPDGSDGGADGQNRGRDGGTESPRSDEVGATHEQPSERSGGNDPHGADLQLSDTEQADSQELSAFLDEAQIMAVIANKDDDLKYKKQQIELFFSVHTDQRERADYLKSAYQDRYTEIIADGQRLGYKPQEDGLLMWEGSYLSRTKESVFSWDLVAGWTAQLIDKKEYFIQTDIRQLPTQESQQMSLFDFPSFGSSTPSEGEPQRSLFSRPALSQQVIDEALCIGANDQNSRLIICAYFKKDKPLEDNTRFLMEHYGENGAGFYLDSRKYSIWYDAEGIHVAEGETAQRTTATLIPWEQAAKRIRELLDLGRYMPQSELDRVDGYERQQRAAQLWYLRQDFAEGTANAGFLPTINAIYSRHKGFPDESAAIEELLNSPDTLQTVRDELEGFIKAYEYDKELLRFRFHRPQKLLEQISDLQREPLHFTAAEGYDPQRRFFISGDEIDNLLRGGKSGTDYRLAVYSFYRNHSDRKEREDFLKHYHGEYSGSHSGNDDVTYQLSKGVHFSHGNLSEPYAKVELKWNAVEKRVSAMIAQGRFLSDEDRAAMPQYEKHQLAQNIRAFFENVPQEQAHPYPYGFDYWDAVKLIEPQLDDPARVEEVCQMMVPVWEATPQDDRMYDLRQRAFENLTAYRQGTFTLFAEKKEPVPPQAVQELQKAYDLGFGHLGNGLTIWNRLEEVDGDYRTVAHIAPDRTVQIYDEEMPQEIRERIQQVADSSEMAVSATQNTPVFSVPPREESPKKEQSAALSPALAAQVLRLMGEFDSSRMGYGEDDAQAVANIAQQLHNTAQRQEIRALLQSFLDHTDPEEEIAAEVALCMEQIDELPQPLTQDQALLEQAKELIDQFCQEEYDSYADFSDLENVGIAYTTVTDEEIPIQVNVDLVNNRVERYLDGQFLERRQYSSLEGLIQNELADLDFDDLTAVSEDELESIGVSQDDYRLLSRLKADCDYYLGAGGRAEKHLWAGSAEAQIAKMRELYDALSEKPEWLTEQDIDRRERLCRIYNETFNSIRPREYDGRHIHFEGMNPEITLRPHQINAIAHILYGGNTLLAHEVGAGKTYEMVAAAMEMKRLGLCTKSLIVVPNHITEQWAAEFLQLYPSANILVATKKDFEKQNRKKFCSRISTGDYDAIIIGHSQFEKIPMSAERQQIILQQQIDEILFGIEQAKSQKAERYTIKQMERTRKSLEAKLAKLNDQSRKDDVVTFEELGVDRIFIDESHYFKNLFLMTKMRNVGGIAQTEAQKSSDLFMKCQYLDELTGGRGVIFATGTPISNSMVELYTIQRYLQYRTLQEMGLIHFDDWASNFGETITAIELSPEGSGYRAKTRFAKFYNLPELMSVFKQVADIQTADMLHLPVPKANFHTEVIKPSEIQQEMIKGLAERAEKIRGGGVDPHVDNMLRITNDGRKLALDMRLIQPLAPDDPDGKVAVCARNVYRIWEQTKEKRSTQLVFCDLSTPTTDGSFSVYDDLKKKLLDAGIPEDEIAFIHTADSEAKKKELFAKVRAGQVRILMGSTQKMGAGTNVQDRLIALHDLDCPWRPSDLQQRLGRIVRQGNENEEVEIFRYVTEGTFDAYLYQLVENKQKFIAQIMTSKAPVRVADDVDETALSYSEIKALATGNPLIIEKCNLDMEVARLNMLKASHLNQVYALEELVHRKYPAEITRLTERIAGYEKDVELAKGHPKAQEGFCGMEVEGKHYTEKEDAGKAIIDVCTKMTGSDAVLLGQYRGFSMVLAYDGMSNEYRITLKGTLSHTVTLGADVFGNITRLDNALENLAGNLDAERAKLEEARVQLENARTELATPFAREDELAEKTARLKELNILLNMDEKDKTLIDEAPDEGEEPPMRKVVGLER